MLNRPSNPTTQADQPTTNVAIFCPCHCKGEQKARSMTKLQFPVETCLNHLVLWATHNITKMVSVFPKLQSEVAAVVVFKVWFSHYTNQQVLQVGPSHNSLPALSENHPVTSKVQSVDEVLSQHHVAAWSVTQMVSRQIVRTCPPSNFTGRGNNEMCLDEIQASVLRLWNKPEHIKRSLQTVSTPSRQPARQTADTKL